jgi:hypothetical protein
VLFSPGVVLAERALYLASVAVCIAAGAVAERFLVQRWSMVAAATASVVLAFGIRDTNACVARQPHVSPRALLADHPESYEAHLTAGRVLRGAGHLDEAERELAISRQLFARDPLVYREAAEIARRQRRPELAAALLDSARLAPALLVNK